MQEVTGMHMHYYMVCKRKLWFFEHNLSMEQHNEDVQMGRIIDESSYDREEKHININNTINIDYIKGNVIHETKKSNKIEDASIMQVKYYIYYLKKHGADGFIGEINYPLLKKKVHVSLEEGDIEKIENICRDIKEICSGKVPEQAKVKKSICKKCAYFDMCMI